MTNEEKKEWLSRYRDAHHRIERLKEQRARAESFGAKKTVSFSAVMGDGTVDRVQLSVERVAQIDTEIAELRRDMPVWEKEIKRALSSIANRDYRRVMQYYYLECLSWADVADLTGYGYRYMSKLDRRVIASLPLKKRAYQGLVEKC